MYCGKCGTNLGAGARFCGNCGAVVESVPQPAQVENKNSSPNASPKGGSIPWEVRGWNWGAFGLNWIWGLGNDTYIALLALIPFVNIVMWFVLGAKGSEWAWRNGHWDSIEHFKSVQKRWAIAWFILLGIGVVLGIIIWAVAASSSTPSYQY